MKREIKFRMWCRDGKWEEDGERRQFVMINANSLCLPSAEPLIELFEDIEDEQYLMQFTGLKDKNGKEIYEGDILKTDKWKWNHIVQFDTKKARFNCIVNTHGVTNDYIPAEYVEVIGNIYENPNLLESARKPT